MIARRIVQAEEIQAVLDGAAEGNDDPRHRAAIRFFDVETLRRHIGIVQHVRNNVLLQRLSPGVVVTGLARIIHEPEELAAQRKHRAVVIRVVDAQSAFRHREIRIQLRHAAREPGIA